MGGNQLSRRVSAISVRCSRAHSWNETALISTAQLSSLKQELGGWSAYLLTVGKSLRFGGSVGKGFKIKLCYVW